MRRQLPSALADDAAQPQEGETFVFTPGSMWAAEFGTKVHELFELVEWTDHVRPRDLENRIREAVHDQHSLERQARDEVLNSLNTPEIAAVFLQKRFGPAAELWREKRFEMVHEGAWISGTFDRVVLSRDASGAYTQGWIFDYKTNRLRSDLEMVQTCDHYAPQMRIYRLALSRLCGLPEDRISSHLIFTRRAKMREVK